MRLAAGRRVEDQMPARARQDDGQSPNGPGLLAGIFDLEPITARIVDEPDFHPRTAGFGVNRAREGERENNGDDQRNPTHSAQRSI